VLGVLLLRQGLPAACDRCARICRLRADRDEDKGTIAWKIKYRNGTEKNFLSPITTKPWGTAIPKLANVPGPSKEMRDSQLLYNEPKWIRMDEGGLHTLQAAGLKLKKGVYY
jgi:adenylylsulfate reductase subunit B